MSGRHVAQVYALALSLTFLVAPTNAQTPPPPPAQRPPAISAQKPPAAPLTQTPPVQTSPTQTPPPSNQPPPAQAPPAPSTQAQPTPPAQSPSPSTSNQATAPLNLVPSAPDVLGQVPQHFIWIRDGLQAVQDPVDGQLVFLNDEGRVLGRAALPAEFRVGSVVSEREQIRLIGVSGTDEIVILRTIDPATNNKLTAGKIAKKRSDTQMQITQRDPRTVVLGDNRRNGGGRLEVRAVSSGTLNQAYEIGVGNNGERFIVTEEVVSNNPLQVQVFAHRYDRNGRVTGLAFVPLDEMEVVPRDFVTVTGAGKLRVLIPTPKGIKIREIGFGAPVRSGNVKSLGAPGPEINVETRIAPVSGAGSFSPQAERFRVAAPTPPMERDKMLVSARAYLAVNWVMTAQNYSKAGVDNLCQPETGKCCTRPTQFNTATIGKTLTTMPYRWGGDDTPETFRVRVQWGALAGDICTCRDPAFDYCIVKDAAGVDCSGFISRVWGIAKRGTWGLLDVSKPVGSLTEMQPGDAFVWPGHHVRLLAARPPSGQSAFTMLESSTRRDCEGVCERSYRPSELNNYRLIRYSGVTDKADKNDKQASR